jgi:molecular chaperone GrpE
MSEEKNSKKNQPNVHEQKAEIENLTSQVQELVEQLKRERADAINLRRRFDEEKKSLAIYHKTEIIKDLLPIVDNFERSLKHVPNDLKDNPYIEGINGIVKQFETVFEKLGVRKIVSLNQTFDPNFHEAIALDDNSDGENEIVSEELQAGYMLGSDVLRPALVKVKRQTN